MNTYRDIYKQSIEQPEDFWKEKSETIDWYEKPKSILSKDENGSFRWFAGGKLNTSYLALDTHVKNGQGDKVALIYDSPVTNTKKKYTYKTLLEQVGLFAGVLRNHGLEKGDTAIIYTPMVPEAVIAMLACARLGAIHSVVFGGFAPHELAVRIDDAKPKIIITSSYGVEIQKIIHYKPMLDEAIHQAHHKPEKVILHQRPNIEDFMHTGRDYFWEEEMEKASPVDPVPVD